jgi:hypothetical protein
MRGMNPAARAEFFDRKFFSLTFLIARGGVVAPLASIAL